MVDITTTRAALIKPEWSDKVPSPAYDSLSPAQRRETRLANPWSFLNVTLSPEDIASRPDSQLVHDVSNDQLITLARESMDRITAAGAFAESSDCMFLYRLQRDDHCQTALITEVSTNNYETGQVKIHEQVKESRAELLAEHLDKLGVISSPIAMTYRNTEEITALFKQAISTEPVLKLHPISGVHQTLWRITDPELHNRFRTAFLAKSLYIIDGHHRAAATVFANRRDDTKQTSPLPLFSALFPHDELKLLGFNRWIKPEEHSNSVELISKLPSATRITAYRPPETGLLTIYTNKQWFEFNLDTGNASSAVTSDAELLQSQLLAPVFGIEQGDHPRISNIPGNQATQILCDTVDEHGGTAIFIAPMSIDDFLSVANSDDLLPPKSTYFTPKVQSGIFLRSTQTD